MDRQSPESEIRTGKAAEAPSAPEPVGFSVSNPTVDINPGVEYSSCCGLTTRETDMTERVDYAGQTVRIKNHVEHAQIPNFGGADFFVEGYWDDISGGSWMNADGNPACLVYALRTGFATYPVPIDNEVLYGKVDGLGHLVHVSEIEAIEDES